MALKSIIILESLSLHIEITWVLSHQFSHPKLILIMSIFPPSVAPPIPFNEPLISLGLSIIFFTNYLRLVLTWLSWRWPTTVDRVSMDQPQCVDTKPVMSAGCPENKHRWGPPWKHNWPGKKEYGSHCPGFYFHHQGWSTSKGKDGFGSQFSRLQLITDY